MTEIGGPPQSQLSGGDPRKAMRSARARPAGQIAGFFAFLFVFAFVGLISSCLITIGIWPGEIKLLAPIFCTDAQPDAFVVADTYNPRPGETVTNFTLYCMGPRGDATDKGFAMPFLAISVVNGVAIFALVFLIGLLRKLRKRRRSDGATTGPGMPGTGSDDAVISWNQSPRPPRQAAPPGSSAGPFVDGR